MPDVVVLSHPQGTERRAMPPAYISVRQASALMEDVLRDVAFARVFLRSASPSRLRELCRTGELAALGIAVERIPNGYLISRVDLLRFLRRTALHVAGNTAAQLGLTPEERKAECVKVIDGGDAI